MADADTDRTLREVIEEAWDYQEALEQESDRGAAVLAFSRFEDFLKEAISTKFIEPDKKCHKKCHKEIFQGRGPLSGFEQRMVIAHALGFYDRETMNGIKIIQRIRNRFAHSVYPLGFDHEGIANGCRALNIVKDTDDFRERYLTFLQETEKNIRCKVYCV